MASEAAVSHQRLLASAVVILPMLLWVGILSFSSTGSGVSFLIVEVDVDRLPRGFFKGPKWVSLNSVHGQRSVLDGAQSG